MNAANFTGSLEPYGEAYWIISEVLISGVTIVSLFYATALVQYALYLRKSNKTAKNHDKQGFLVALAIAGNLFALGRFVSDHCVAFLGWKTDDYCRISTSFSFALYSASAFPVYFFLWKRQHTFYCDSHLRSLYSKPIIWINYSSVISLIIFWLIATVLYQIPSATGWLYQATETGCRDTNDERDVEFLPLLVNFVAGFGQLSLLGLLLYPLLRLNNGQNKKVKREEPGTSNDASLPRHQVHQGEKPDAMALSVAYNKNGDISFHQHAVNEPANMTDDDVFQSETEAEQKEKVEVTPNRTPINTKPLYTRKSETLPRPTNKKHLLGHHRTDSSSSAQNMIVRKHQSPRKTLNKEMKRSRSQKKREKKMSRLIRKVFFLALTCVCTDVVATILQLFLVVPELAYLAIYDVNLILNITCIILSFNNWKQILIPWRNENKCGANRSRTDSVTSQSSVSSARFQTNTLERRMKDKRLDQLSKSRRPSEATSLSSNRTWSFNLSRPGSPSH